MELKIATHPGPGRVLCPFIPCFVNAEEGPLHFFTTGLLYTACQLSIPVLQDEKGIHTPQVQGGPKCLLVLYCLSC